MNMNLTDWLAIIGAITGCAAVFWDIFKWINSGAKLKLNLASNMIIFGGFSEELSDKKNVSVEVVNRGDKKTTITHLSMAHYKSPFRALLKMAPDSNFAVPDPGYGKLPHLLDVGERWIGFIDQTERLEKLASDGYLYIGINHSSSDNFIRKRLIIKPSE